MSPGTLFVLAILALIVGYTIRNIWKNRGKGACSSCPSAKHGCSHCSSSKIEITGQDMKQDAHSEKCSCGCSHHINE